MTGDFIILNNISYWEIIWVIFSLFSFVILLRITQRQRHKDRLRYLTDWSTLPTFIAIKDKTKYNCRFEHAEFNTDWWYFTNYKVHIDWIEDIVSEKSKRACIDRLRQLWYIIKI